MALNGTRNFELLTTYVANYLGANLSLGFGLTIYREYYAPIDENNVPALNILLKSVDEIRRDSNTTVNECVITVIGYMKCSTQGNGNSLKSKTDLLKILGQVNNIFSKRSSYDIVPNHIIQNVKLSNIVFSTPADFNSNQMLLGQQEMTFIVTETNDDSFSVFLNQIASEINGEIQVIAPTGGMCEDALIVNSNRLFQIFAPSGQETEIPDTDVIVKDLANNVIGSGTVPSVSGGEIQVDVTPPACQPATAVLKDTAGVTISTESIDSGATENIIAPDASYLFQYANGTLIDSGTIKSNGSKTVTAPNPLTPSVGATLIKTGITASVADYDDGYYEMGRGVDFFTLSAVPLHSDGTPTINTTTSRFTDEQGGQTFTNSIIIDWFTFDNLTGKVLGWYIGDASTARNGDATLTACNAYNIVGFTGWSAPNGNHYWSIVNYGLTSWLNYAPFNYTLGLGSGSILGGNRFIIIPGLRSSSFPSIANAYRHFAVRNFTAVRTTLT